MNILVCMDSWKGSLSAPGACAAVAAGLRSVVPDWTVREHPLADGGEGTVDLLHAACGGERCVVEVQGPLSGQRISATFLYWEHCRTAVVEMAEASGLPLVPVDQRNPLQTTSYGTGELIREALRKGAERILLAVGGSATVDGGMGMAQALGWRFQDADGQEVPGQGCGLAALCRILPPEPVFPARLEVLCDVENPLTGPRGAAAVFGPQKGADEGMVAELEAGLINLARVIRRDLGVEIELQPGAGAAGGMAAAALAFLGGSLVSGIDRLMSLSGLEEAMGDADWVVTGEGALDHQSLGGKVVSGVARLARRQHAALAVVAGTIALDEADRLAAGIQEAEAARRPGMPLETALRDAETLAREAGRRLATRL